jgi:hypothetical protein
LEGSREIQRRSDNEDNGNNDPAFVRQAKEDTETGRGYKRIFESKTIL